MSDKLYKEVQFVTTASDVIPAYLSQTGSLIVMTDTDGTLPEYEKERSSYFNSYLYLRDKLIAGGVGFTSFEEKEKASYLAYHCDDIYAKLDATYAYVSYLGQEIREKLTPISNEYIETYLNWNNL